jgi:hypothetical protein
MEKESRNYRNSQLKHCLLKGVLTDSCRDYNKLLIQVPCLPAGGDSCRDYNKLLTQVPCLPAGRPACRQAGIPVGTTFFIVENDHDIEAIYWPHISSGTGFLQNSILAE